MKPLKIITILLVSIIFFSCSGSKDLSSLTPEERFALAKTKFDKKDYLEAISDFESIMIQFSGTGIVDDAQYYLAYSYFKRGEYIKAAYEFSKLIRDYPTSEYVKDAQFMLAESYYELSPHYTLDQSFTEKAIEEYQAFIDFFPQDPRIKEAEKKIIELNDKLARKVFETAEQYRRMNYTKSAIIYYDLLLEKYPDSKYSSLALYNKIKLLVEKARKKEALEEAKKYLRRFPSGEYKKDVEKIVEQLEKIKS
ncbi:MAG: outer membrane protein assembly factor BamD [Ignavibacteria bacterium]|nr:outer membrane protein assembly factor BamD [Ignavibacteria bacterium]